MSLLQEIFKIMGCSEGIMWISLYVFYGVWFGVLSFLLSLCAIPLYPGTSIFVVFLLLWCFTFACISFGILISAFFSRGRTAAVVGLGIYFILFIFFFGMEFSHSSHSVAAKRAMMLLLPTALCWGHQTLLGIQLSGFGTVVPGTSMGQKFRGVSVGDACGFLLLDTLIYFILGWYFHQLFPGEFGVPRPWYFPFTSTFWSGVFYMFRKSEKNGGFNSQASIRYSEKTSGDFFEPIDPLDKRRSVIELSGVRRRFVKRNVFGCKPKEFEAVKGVSFEVKEGEIFALLGHNGAGKTTLINILTGMLEASSGHASIMGYDVQTQTGQARDNLGFCPQFDILFDFLTVREHLVLFGIMKGVKRSLLEGEIDEILTILNITEKKNSLSKTLSGGQKRRVSVAIALVGGAKAIFLDEPSTGMDPYTRRALWDTLKSIKKGRAIILTTHFMEEADVLGDRIGIMNNGLMTCLGTSLFLKSKFGVGYTLVFTKRDDYNSKQADKLNHFIEERLPGSSLISDIALEIAFRVPFSTVGPLADVLLELEQHSMKYGVLSFSLSVTTLEEVFLAVAALAHSEIDVRELSKQLSKQVSQLGHGKKLRNVNSLTRAVTNSDADSGVPVHKIANATTPRAQSKEMIDEEDGDVFASVERIPEETRRSFKFGFIKIRALLTKRALVGMRDLQGLLCQILVPVVVVIVMLTIATQLVGSVDQQDVQFISSVTNYPYVNLTPQKIYYGMADDYELQAQMEQTMQACSGGFTAVKIPTGNTLKGMEDFLMKQREVDLYPSYFSLYFDNAEKMTLVHDSRFIHAIPLALNVLLDCNAKSIAPNANVVMHHYPLPRDNGLLAVIAQMFSVVWAVVGFTLIPSTWGAFSVRERQVGSKHAQHMAGITVPQYWIALWIWDFISFLLPFAVVIIIMLAFDIQSVDSDHIGATLLAGLLFGFAIAPFTYLLSFTINSPMGAQILMFFMAIFFPFLLAMLQIISDTAKTYQDWLQYILLFIPHVAVCQVCDTSLILPASLFMFQSHQSFCITNTNLTYIVFLCMDSSSVHTHLTFLSR